MEVVAFDLPNEVERYIKYVYYNSKKTLLANKNIQIFSGNGILPLKKQFQNKKNWIIKDRKIPLIDKKKPIILRAANSIDIYITWG